MMTASKALASGIAANIVTLCLWAISTIPGWEHVPDAPKAAIIGLVSSGIAAAIVYFAPANKQTVGRPAVAAAGAAAPPIGNPQLSGA